MRNRRAVFTLALLASLPAQSTLADDPPAKPVAPPAAQPPAAAKPSDAPSPVPATTVVEKLNAEAAALRKLPVSDLCKQFLDATAALPEPVPQVIYRTKDKSRAYSVEQAAALPEAERWDLTERPCSPEFYYYTGYGSPLVYARVIDILAGSGVKTLAGKRVMDFGCGTIGHLRNMAAMGADVHGVEVEPLFGALYGESEDQGAVPGHAGAPTGSVTMHIGRWPADKPITEAVGGKFDIITSKNTLKKSYIHPEREVDEKFLVKLGVDDDTFVRTVYDALKPGGFFLIYNIAPAQNPPDKPYLPHADGRSPFPRELLEKTGFAVMAFDQVDSDTIFEYWKALGYHNDKDKAETLKDLFAHFTLCRKPEAVIEKPAASPK